ncbi:MAG: hypothetical protein AABX70_01445 [Nanoarchaeota archaeon]
MKQHFLFVLCFSFFIILNIYSVSATSRIGSSVPYDQRIVTFNPGGEASFTFTVGDSGGIEAYIQTDEELTPYVKLIDPSPLGGTREVTVQIKFGDSLSPGEHRIIFGARETSSGGGVAALTGVETAIRVISLSSEKTIRGNMNVQDVNEGENASLSVSVKSWTYQDIQSLYSDIDVFNSQGDKVAHFRTEKFPLKSGESSGVTTLMETQGMKPGWYQAVANIFYDGSNISTGDDFKIGTLKVDITSYTKELRVDSLNKFEIGVQSNWNLPLKDVYGEVEWEGKNEKTPTINIPRFEGGILTTYLDAQGVPLGERPIKITVFYNGDKTERLGTVKVIKSSEVIEKPGEVKGEFNYMYMVLLILILVNLLFIILWRKKKEKEENNRTK